MKTVTHGTRENTAGAATTTYKKGDLAWYRQRDGTFVPAKVSFECILDLLLHAMFALAYVLLSCLTHLSCASP